MDDHMHLEEQMFRMTKAYLFFPFQLLLLNVTAAPFLLVCVFRFVSSHISLQSALAPHASWLWGCWRLRRPPPLTRNPPIRFHSRPGPDPALMTWQESVFPDHEANKLIGCKLCVSCSVLFSVTEGWLWNACELQTCLWLTWCNKVPF